MELKCGKPPKLAHLAVFSLYLFKLTSVYPTLADRIVSQYSIEVGITMEP